MRRRSSAGLNKGEARNARPDPVFHRHGEIRDRTFAVAAVIPWNTIYLGRAVAELRAQGEAVTNTIPFSTFFKLRLWSTPINLADLDGYR